MSGLLPAGQRARLQERATQRLSALCRMWDGSSSVSLLL